VSFVCFHRRLTLNDREEGYGKARYGEEGCERGRLMIDMERQGYLVDVCSLGGAVVELALETVNA
jgi:hypothetical protein